MPYLESLYQDAPELEDAEFDPEDTEWDHVEQSDVASLTTDKKYIPPTAEVESISFSRFTPSQVRKHSFFSLHYSPHDKSLSRMLDDHRREATATRPCGTCRGNTADKCVPHPSHVEFTNPSLSLTDMKTVMALLSVICPNCSQLLVRTGSVNNGGDEDCMLDARMPILISSEDAQKLKTHSRKPFASLDPYSLSQPLPPRPERVSKTAKKKKPKKPKTKKGRKNKKAKRGKTTKDKDKDEKTNASVKMDTAVDDDKNKNVGNGHENDNDNSNDNEIKKSGQKERKASGDISSSDSDMEETKETKETKQIDEQEQVEMDLEPDKDDIDDLDTDLGLRTVWPTASDVDEFYRERQTLLDAREDEMKLIKKNTRGPVKTQTKKRKEDDMARYAIIVRARRALRIINRKLAKYNEAAELCLGNIQISYNLAENLVAKLENDIARSQTEPNTLLYGTLSDAEKRRQDVLAAYCATRSEKLTTARENAAVIKSVLDAARAKVRDNVNSYLVARASLGFSQEEKDAESKKKRYKSRQRAKQKRVKQASILSKHGFSEDEDDDDDDTSESSDDGDDDDDSDSDDDDGNDKSDDDDDDEKDNKNKKRKSGTGKRKGQESIKKKKKSSSSSRVIGKSGKESKDDDGDDDKDANDPDVKRNKRRRMDQSGKSIQTGEERVSQFIAPKKHDPMTMDYTRLCPNYKTLYQKALAACASGEANTFKAQMAWMQLAIKRAITRADKKSNNLYCSMALGGCGSHIPKFQKSGVKIFYSLRRKHPLSHVIDGGVNAHETIFTAGQVLQCFRRISIQDQKMLGINTTSSSPETLVSLAELQPPASSLQESPTTIVYIDKIITMESAQREREALLEQTTGHVPALGEIVRDPWPSPLAIQFCNAAIDIQNYRSATLTNGPLLPKSDNAVQAYKQQKYFIPVDNNIVTMCNKKLGIFRLHMNGKRLDFSGRAVVVCDARMGLRQMGIGEKLARITSKLVHVTASNIVEMKRKLDEIQERRRNLWAVLKEIRLGAISQRPSFIQTDSVSENDINFMDVYPNVSWIKHKNSESWVDMSQPEACPRYSDKVHEGCTIQMSVETGDFNQLLSNRQPTLDLDSEEANEMVVIMGGGYTLHFSPNKTVKFNADFDGDVMTFILINQFLANVQAKMMLQVTTHMLGSEANGNKIGAIQDTQLAAYRNLLSNGLVDAKQYRLYCSMMHQFRNPKAKTACRRTLFKPVIKGRQADGSGDFWSWRQVYSQLLPEGLFYKRFNSKWSLGSSRFNIDPLQGHAFHSTPETSEITAQQGHGHGHGFEPDNMTWMARPVNLTEPAVIVNGCIVSGTWTAEDMGIGPSNLIKAIVLQFGGQQAEYFLDDLKDIMRINFQLQSASFTLGDVVMDRQARHVIDLKLNDVRALEAKERAEWEQEDVKLARDQALVQSLGGMGRIFGESWHASRHKEIDDRLMEQMFRRTKVIDDSVLQWMKSRQPSPTKSLVFKLDSGLPQHVGLAYEMFNYVNMILAGIKGKPTDFREMAYHLGPQFLDNYLIPANMNGRAMPFCAGARQPEQRGYSPQKYVTGLGIKAWFAHIISSRKKVADSSSEIPKTGLIQHAITTVLENLITQEDGSVRDFLGRIIAFAYGGSGSDAERLMPVVIPIVDYICFKAAIDKGGNPLVKSIVATAKDTIVVNDKTRVEWNCNNWQAPTTETPEQLLDVLMQEYHMTSDCVSSTRPDTLTDTKTQKHGDIPIPYILRPDSRKRLEKSQQDQTCLKDEVKKLRDLYLGVWCPTVAAQMRPLSHKTNMFVDIDDVVDQQRWKHCKLDPVKYPVKQTFEQKPVEVNSELYPCYIVEQVERLIKQIHSHGNDHHRHGLGHEQLMMEFYIRSSLCSKRVLTHYKMSKMLFVRVLDTIHKAFILTRAVAGRSTGIDVGTSIGRPFTQGLLNTKHVGSKAVHGTDDAVRMKILLNCRKSKPDMRMEFVLRPYDVRDVETCLTKWQKNHVELAQDGKIPKTVIIDPSSPSLMETRQDMDTSIDTGSGSGSASITTTTTSSITRRSFPRRFLRRYHNASYYLALAFRNMCSMMKARGYKWAGGEHSRSFRPDMDIEKFELQYGDRPFALLRSRMSCFWKPCKGLARSNNLGRVLVRFCNAPSPGIPVLVSEHANLPEGIHHVILVVQGVPLPRFVEGVRGTARIVNETIKVDGKGRVVNLDELLLYEQFTEHELLIDLLAEPFMPAKCSLIPKNLHALVHRLNRVKKDDMQCYPVLYNTDMLSRWLGLQPNDLVRIECRTLERGSDPGYWYVHDDVHNVVQEWAKKNHRKPAATRSY